MVSGYHSSIVDDAFDKFSDIANRENLHAPKNNDVRTQWDRKQFSARNLVRKPIVRA